MRKQKSTKEIEKEAGKLEKYFRKKYSDK